MIHKFICVEEDCGYHLKPLHKLLSMRIKANNVLKNMIASVITSLFMFSINFLVEIINNIAKLPLCQLVLYSILYMYIPIV